MNWMTNLKISTRLTLGFVSVVVITLILSVITYSNFAKYSTADGWNIHTYKVLGDLDNLTMSMINMETGQRGFSLTGDEKFLEPFYKGKEDFDKYFDDVKQLTSDNPKQQDHLQQINNTHLQWLDVANKNIDLRREVAKGTTLLDDVVQREAKAEGKAFMDKLRTVIEQSKEMENGLLEKRIADSTDLHNMTNLVLVFGTLLAMVVAIVIGILCTWSITRGIKKITDAAQNIAKGKTNIDIDVSSKDEIGTLANAFREMIAAVVALVTDANMLSAAAVEGKLSTRADTSSHQGDFRKIIEGVNSTLDAVIEPVKEASAVLQEMSRGNLHVNVQGNYKGDHAAIKDALNDTINSILGYVSEVSAVLTEMADGNLDVGITAEYKGDFVGIKNSLNHIVQSLNEVLGDINEAADQVASGSSQVSDGSLALSQGSTEQASSVEQLSASITEIATQTKQNALNANQANELALNAKEYAAQGNEQMKEMLGSMVEINASSANISKIIKVIDEIAFQTNILALNAAVEAARAGQHGKGFAVVAEEVRNLAARSANAAKETTGLIEGSIKNVEAGTKIANETAEALQKIVMGIEKAADLVGDIDSASNEQASGIAQINLGIEQVSLVVQTNSATAEESAAASEELSSQSELLKEMVGRFKLKRSRNQGRAGLAFLEEERNYHFAARSRMASADQELARSEAATAGRRPRIVLSESEFGKY